MVPSSGTLGTNTQPSAPGHGQILARTQQVHQGQSCSHCLVMPLGVMEVAYLQSKMLLHGPRFLGPYLQLAVQAEKVTVGPKGGLEGMQEQGGVGAMW